MYFLNCFHSRIETFIQYMHTILYDAYICDLVSKEIVIYFMSHILLHIVLDINVKINFN